MTTVSSVVVVVVVSVVVVVVDVDDVLLALPAWLALLLLLPLSIAVFMGSRLEYCSPNTMYTSTGRVHQE